MSVFTASRMWGVCLGTPSPWCSEGFLTGTSVYVKGGGSLGCDDDSVGVVVVRWGGLE